MASFFDRSRSTLWELVCGLSYFASLAACSNGATTANGASDAAVTSFVATNVASNEVAMASADVAVVAAFDAGSAPRDVFDAAAPVTQSMPSAPSTASQGTPTLFWLDVSGKVLTSEAQDFKARNLVDSAGRGSDGIAVDLERGHIYWTNMGVPADDDGTLMRADLDGGNVTTLITEGVTFTPKQLKLEPSQGKLYWSDREGMRVMRAGLDGEQVETLYAAAQGATARRDARNWCVGITVDVAGGYFYWTQKGDDDETTGTIRRAPLAMASNETSQARSDVEILFAELAAPVDLDLDLENDYLYWTNRGDDTVNRGPITMPAGETAKTRSDREILVRDVTQAIGIALDRARGLIYYTTAVGDLGRAKLDGSDAQYLQSGRGALTGISIVDVP